MQSSQHDLSMTTPPTLSQAKDLCNLGIDRDTQGRHFEAIASYDAVITQFGQQRTIEFTEIVAKAMYNKGCALVALGADLEAISAFDALVQKFSTASEAAVLQQVIKALMNKGHRLGAHRHGTASIACYEAVVAQYGKNQDPNIQPLTKLAQDFLAKRSLALKTTS